MLLGGPSSFTSLAAALNQFGVKVVPRFKDPAEDKFLGIDRTVGQDKILHGDMVIREPWRCMYVLPVYACMRKNLYHSISVSIRIVCL